MPEESPMLDFHRDTPRDTSLLDRLCCAQAGGCTCGVKTPARAYHDPMCSYRLFGEAGAEIDELRRKLANADLCIAKFAKLIPVYVRGTTEYLNAESVEFLRPTAENGTRVFFREVEIAKPIEEVAKLLQVVVRRSGDE